MNAAKTISVIELLPIEMMERRMQRIVELVNLAGDMGYDINGFQDENDLLRKVSQVEIELLTDVIHNKGSNVPANDIFLSELKLEKFNAIACRILDAVQY
jgi:hypothetical protein